MSERFSTVDCINAALEARGWVGVLDPITGMRTYEMPNQPRRFFLGRNGSLRVGMSYPNAKILTNSMRGVLLRNQGGHILNARAEERTNGDHS